MLYQRFFLCFLFGTPYDISVFQIPFHHIGIRFGERFCAETYAIAVWKLRYAEFITCPTLSDIHFLLRKITSKFKGGIDKIENS